MSDNPLNVKSIHDLLDLDFFVPDFQRGYRWSTTEVLALMDDIWSWKYRDPSTQTSKDEFYCLQPIVVAPSDSGWIVIDGQQRLTTIHLILTQLKTYLEDSDRQNFRLTYETREDCAEFLANPDMALATEDVDYYHIADAYDAIAEWFKAKGGNAKMNFFQTLTNSNDEGNNVRVIWYRIDADESNNHIDIFTRLNIGKIPLTNAELIKALLLQKRNFPFEEAALKQIQIAAEWDQVERTLQNDEFWYFLTNKDDGKRYDNRIELIFDFMYDRSADMDHYYTFHRVVKELKGEDAGNDTGAEELWLSVKSYFLTFEEWYHNRELYHLIGFLVHEGEPIPQLKSEGYQKTKEEFKEHLYQLVSSKVNFEIEDLGYESQKEQRAIRRVLLLFNIRTLHQHSGVDMRFPFDKYKKGFWDLEHIKSQKDPELRSEKQQRDWLRDIVQYFVGGYSQLEDIHKALDHMESEDKQILCRRLSDRLHSEDIDAADFETLKTDVEKYFDQATLSDQLKDSIGNLALLDEKTNRSYKNALFPIKRRRIITNDQIGVFVPICTKNVFLKYHSEQLADLMHWSDTDAKSYMQAIKDTLIEFLPEQNYKHEQLTVD